MFNIYDVFIGFIVFDIIIIFCCFVDKDINFFIEYEYYIIYVISNLYEKYKIYVDVKF